MRKGGWMTTFSGRKFYPADPRPEDVEPVDIIHGLSNTCRFSGQVSEFYSVAQHSVLVSEHAGRSVGEGMTVRDTTVVWQLVALTGLLHDASEAYIADLPRPAKRELPAYKEMESAIQRCVLQRFGLWEPHESSSPYGPVKAADLAALRTEIRDLMLTDTSQIHDLDDIEPFPDRIEPWSPEEARLHFRRRLAYLCGEATPFLKNVRNPL